MKRAHGSRQDPVERAGRFLWIGLPGPEIDSAARELLLDVRPSGIVLFRRNLADAAQIHQLVRRSAEIAGTLLVAIDQEGGRVDRMSGIAGPFPAARTVACSGKAAFARVHGKATGRLLKSLGIGVDFAPVLDLDRGYDNGIGDRSYGRVPEEVVRFAAAFLSGLRNAGAAGCLKHFPGLGASRVDSHFELPRVELDSGALKEDLAPFYALLGDADSVMVAHCLFPGLGEAKRSASRSSRLIAGLLRRRLGYRGPVISDDLEMKAVDLDDCIEETSVDALRAGCDFVLVCQDPSKIVRARDGIAAALRRKTFRESGVRASLRRGEDFGNRFGTSAGARFRPARFARALEVYRDAAARVAAAGG